MSRAFLFVLTFALLFTACDSAQPSNTPLPETEPEPDVPGEPQLVETEFLPLLKGNEWDYEFHTLLGTRAQRYMVGSDTLVGGLTYSKLHILEEGEEPDLFLLRYDDEGLVWANPSGEQRFYFLYPDDRSGTWSDEIYTVREFTNTVYKAFLHEEGVTVETPSGTYTGCYKYRHYQEDKRTGQVTLNRHFWFKPGVGLVKEDYTSSFGSSERFLAGLSLK